MGPRTYLNNAGQARLDPEVQALGIACIEQPVWNMHADKDQQEVRKLFAQLISTDAKNIAIMPSTAFAISLAAHNIQKILTGKRGRIVVLQDQMCSAVYPWERLCSESDGISLDVVPYPGNDQTWTDKVLERLKQDNGSLVACLPPLHWADGALLDLARISEVCRQSCVTLIVDATQAIGVLQCDVDAIRPAMLACSVHKWLRGPSGASLVYVDPNLHAIWQPLDQHGRSRKVSGDKTWDASKDKMGPEGYSQEFAEDARKFDSGGKPNPILLPMLRGSMEQVIQLDVLETQAKLGDLVTPLIQWAHSNGFTLPNAHAFHILGLRSSNLSPTEMIAINDELERQGIDIAVRCGAFRVSPYLDTTPADIQILINALTVLFAKR
jgi:selenocysteine lyase/cysteine desulfurase